MSNRAIELRVGGQSYKVVSSASPDDLERLAAKVDAKLSSLVSHGRPLNPNALLLAALALAHEAEEQRERAELISSRARMTVERLLGRVDEALLVTENVLAHGAAAPEAE